jgi:hypothetical protein
MVHGPLTRQLTLHVAPALHSDWQRLWASDEGHVCIPQSQQPEHFVKHVPESLSQPSWFTHVGGHCEPASLPASVETVASVGVAASVTLFVPASMSPTPESKKSASKSRPQPADAPTKTRRRRRRRMLRFFRTTSNRSTILRRVRWTLCLAIALWTLPVAAAPESIDEARTLMQDGNARLHAGKPAEALEKLERSLALVYSPNTELLLARALRDLGRRVEAARAFEHAELEARKRSLAGEVKYGMTEASAHDEGAKVRAQLGTLRIHVANAKNATLTVDGAATPLATEGDTTVLHEPGRAEIALRVGDSEQKQTVPVVAGAMVQVEFGGASGTDRTAPPPPAPPPAERAGTSAPPGTTSSWATPAAIVSGSFAAVGLGVFTVFGLRAESAFGELSDRCGRTGCGDADRPLANEGERDQVIANSGLIVASIAAVATVAFVVISLASSSSSTGAGSLFDGRRRAGL